MRWKLSPAYLWMICKKSLATGLAAATIGKALDAMQEQLGMVQEFTGKKRNRVYACRAYIDMLNQETCTN